VCKCICIYYWKSRHKNKQMLSQEPSHVHLHLAFKEKCSNHLANVTTNFALLSNPESNLRTERNYLTQCCCCFFKSCLQVEIVSTSHDITRQTSNSLAVQKDDVLSSSASVALSMSSSTEVCIKPGNEICHVSAGTLMARSHTAPRLPSTRYHAIYTCVIGWR